MKKLISVLLVLVMSACLFVPALAVQAEAAGPKVLDFDAGDDFCGVVDQNNTLWMWGANQDGQLGNGDDVDVYMPTVVMQDVLDVLCGPNITMVIKTDKTLWTWGNNTYGQLGNGWKYDKTFDLAFGKMYYQTTPMIVLDDVVAMSASDGYTMAIKSDHSLWAWGLINFLGGSVSGNQPVYNSNGKLDYSIQTIPVKIMDNVLDISCGTSVTAAVKDDHSLWVWTSRNRENDYIGETPRKLMDGVSSASCGKNHIMIKKDDGTLWMFGYGSNGSLGNGSLERGLKAPFKLMDGVKYVAAGSGGTSAAIKEDGSLWVWGDNINCSLLGREGNNNTSLNKDMGGVQDVPAQIAGQWDRITMGDQFCLAEKDDGSLWAWGSNRFGQIGKGDTNGDIRILYSGAVGSSSSDGYFYVVASPTQVSIPVQGMSAWAGPEVSAAISAGLVPENLQQNYPYPVSRGNVAQMFVNLLEKSSGKTIEQIMAEKGVTINTGAFVDTTDKAVLACNALGIINGIGNNQFSPDGTFTRSQIAAIINRVARVMGVKTDGYTHSFTDVKGHWVDSELGWPVHAGIINGIGDNRFDPDGRLTTEQAIAIAYRALQVLKTN